MIQLLKRGVGARNEEGLIRIYYYYDRDLKKTFIGYMPGHLAGYRDFCESRSES